MMDLGIPDRCHTTAGGVRVDFYDEPHIYAVKGQPVPSVTTIINDVFPELYANTHTFALERGSAVHRAMHLHVQGLLDEASLTPYTEGFVRAGQKFLAESDIEIYATEEIVYNTDWGYAGTLDVRGVMDGAKVIVDWKTGNPGWQGGLQTAAHAAALGIPRTYGRMCVWLREDGSYKAIEYTDEGTDLQDFLAALRVYNRRRRS